VNLAAAILVDGLIDASWLFIVAVGLTHVFGVLNILNTRFGAAPRPGVCCNGRTFSQHA
jgi:branched-chain amino acid transport system permease protein